MQLPWLTELLFKALDPISTPLASIIRAVTVVVASIGHSIIQVVRTCVPGGWLLIDTAEMAGVHLYFYCALPLVALTTSIVVCPCKLPSTVLEYLQHQRWMTLFEHYDTEPTTFHASSGTGNDNAMVAGADMRQRCIKHGLDKNDESAAWLVHTEATYAVHAKHARSDSEAVRECMHVRAAFWGRVPNSQLETSDILYIMQADGLVISKLLGNWSHASHAAERAALQVLLPNLNTAAKMADIAYAGIRTEDDAETIGCDFDTLGSWSHSTACTIGYQRALPRRPLTENCQPLVSSNPTTPEMEAIQQDLHINIVFRGSYLGLGSPHNQVYDWLGSSFLGWLVETQKGDGISAGETTYRVHTGFYKRYLAIWPLIKERILEYVMFKYPDAVPFNDRKVQFTVTGHSQGGALATFVAMAIENELSHLTHTAVRLFTFSSPPVFHRDDPSPLAETCIRHFRFSIDNDVVCQTHDSLPACLHSLYPRRHVGRTSFIFHGACKELQLPALGAHLGFQTALGKFDALLKRLNDTGSEDIAMRLQAFISPDPGRL
eukprot:m.144447 g.144447  ORF g.144447 m.144447 type:complete len:548 (+) comp16197_c0_seq1:165-1808(+)